MKTKSIKTIIVTLFLASMLSITVITPATAITGANVVGYWHFDEGEGNIAYDSSDYTNDGTLSGGKFGNALSFDGTDDFVEIADADSLSFTDGSDNDKPFTIEAWIKMDDATNFRIVGKYAYPDFGFEFQFDIDGSDRLRICVLDLSAYAYLGRRYNAPLTSYENSWIHVAGTYDGSETLGGLKLYLNGLQVDDTDMTLGIYSGMENTNAPVWIGRIKHNVDYFAKGIIDEVRISNIARTSFDLTLAPSDDTNTVALWHFDEGTGGITYDETANDNDGTIYGATWTGTPPTWTTGKYGGMALQFDGVDDYVEVTGSESGSLDIADAITCEAWVFIEGTDTYKAIVGKGFPGGYGPPSDRSYLLDIITTSGTTKARFNIVTGETNTWKVATSSETLSLNTWYHLAGTYDGSAVKIYVNGVERGSTSYIGTIRSSNQPVRIGSWGDVTNFWNGIIDEVRIWNVALPAEVVAVAATGKMEYLDIAGLVIFTSVFHDLADDGTVTVQILADPGVTITGVSVHRTTPKKLGGGAYATGTIIDDFSISVVFDFGSPPCKTIHLWLYLSTGEHIGVNLQHAR